MLPTTNKVFFELLQVAIGTRRELSHILSQEEWYAIYAESKKQALIGVCFYGVSRLKSPQTPPIKLLAQLVHNAEMIKGKNETLNEQCKDVCELLRHDGFEAVVLKGQGNLVNYVDDSNESQSSSAFRLADYRTPGDIDVWCWWRQEDGYPVATRYGKSVEYEYYFGNKAVIEYVRLQYRMDGLSMPEVNYHHVDWCYKGGHSTNSGQATGVEVHFRPSWMNCPWHNNRLQQWANWIKDEGAMIHNLGFPIPTSWFNVVYQLSHIYRHLFNEGIGLRQLLDYYMVLRKYHNEYGECVGSPTVAAGFGRAYRSPESLNSTIKYVGMENFEEAVMWVLGKVFIPEFQGSKLPWMLCDPDAKRGQFLLDEIMYAGNFGKYDDRNKIDANEGYLKRFIRRQQRFLRFLTQYPSEVIWGPYFTIKQRLWRIANGYK